MMGRRSIRDEVKSAEFAQIKSVLEKKKGRMGEMGGGQQGCVSGEGVCECRGFNGERVRIRVFCREPVLRQGPA